MKLKLYSPASTPAPDFVPVKSSTDKTPLEIDKLVHADRSGCTVTLASGTRIDFYGELPAGVIQSIMASVS